MTAEEYLEKFLAITQKMYGLTKMKNHDYAPDKNALDNFDEFGAKGVLVRISDKFKRLKNTWYVDRETAVADETIEDTMMDMAVYSIIMLILYREEKRNKELDKELEDKQKRLEAINEVSTDKKKPRPPEGPLHIRIQS